MAQGSSATEKGRFDRWYEAEVIQPISDFQDRKQEWRRLVSEFFGILPRLVAAGGGKMGEAFPDTIDRGAAVVAPGLMVLAIILFMGKVSGAHLNPAVTLAFSLRGDFPWRRVPGYIVVQLAGAALAAWFLRLVIDVSSSFGSNYPADGCSDRSAFTMEAVLTFGLVSVILGTASGAQNIGIIGALGVGGYIALAGLWGSPISGASMNPARTFGPDLVARRLPVLGLRRRPASSELLIVAVPRSCCGAPAGRAVRGPRKAISNRRPSVPNLSRPGARHLCSAATASRWRRAATIARRVCSFAPTWATSSARGISRRTGMPAGRAERMPSMSMSPSPGNSRSKRAVWIRPAVVVGISPGASHTWA